MLAGRVRWLGGRADVPALMSAADAFVMSSRWEGMPMAALEACAARLPVVATHVGGIPDVVADGLSGYLVPPGEPGALAAAMDRLMWLEEAERFRMGQAGREHVLAQYSIEAIAIQWERIYDRLLTASRRTGARVFPTVDSGTAVPTPPSPARRRVS